MGRFRNARIGEKHMGRKLGLRQQQLQKGQTLFHSSKCCVRSFICVRRLAKCYLLSLIHLYSFRMVSFLNARLGFVIDNETDKIHPWPVFFSAERATE